MFFKLRGKGNNLRDKQFCYIRFTTCKIKGKKCKKFYKMPF